MSQNEKLALLILFVVAFAYNGSGKSPTNWQKLILIDKVKSNREAFGREVILMAKRMNVNADWLMFIFYFETARTFNHTIENDNGCVGLIQFCEESRSDLGVTSAQLKAMTNVEQLKYVEKYFTVFYSQKLKAVRNAGDLYLIVFFPLASGKPDSFVLQTAKVSAAKIYAQNPFFQDGSGVITVGTVRKKINEFIQNSK